MCSLEQARPDIAQAAAAEFAEAALPAPLTWYARMAPDGSGVQLCRVLKATEVSGAQIEPFPVAALAAINLGHALINLGIEAQQAAWRARLREARS